MWFFRSVGDNHHVAAGIVALRQRRHAVDIADRVVHDLAITRTHRLKLFAATVVTNILGHLGGEGNQGFLAALAVPVDIDAYTTITTATSCTLHGRTGQLLNGRQCRSARPNHESQIGSRRIGHDGLTIVADVHGCIALENLGQAADEIGHQVLLFLGGVFVFHGVLLVASSS